MSHLLIILIVVVLLVIFIIASHNKPAWRRIMVKEGWPYSKGFFHLKAQLQ